MVLGAIDQGSLPWVFPLSFTSWSELCLTSCCSFTAIWTLFPLLSASQTSPVISTALFSPASASSKAGGVTPCASHTQLSRLLQLTISSLLFVCLDSTKSQLHCNFPPLQASCKELSVPGWNALLPPCVVEPVLQGTRHKTQGTDVMLLGEMTCFSMSLFFKV